MAERKASTSRKSPGRSTKPAKHGKKQAKDKKNWEEAEVVVPDGKTQLTVRFDSDLVDWFKDQGPKYQTRMNQVLRKFMEHQGTAEVIEPNQEKNLLLEIQCTKERNKNERLFALNRLGEYWLNRDNGPKACEFFEKAANLASPDDLSKETN